MKVSVMVFASFREIAGAGHIDVEMPPGNSWTIAELRKSIAEQFPALAGHMPSTMFAVNESMAKDVAVFKENDRVAAMPPVSGG